MTTDSGILYGFYIWPETKTRHRPEEPDRLLFSFQSPNRKKPLRLPLLHKGNSSMCLLWSTGDGGTSSRSVIFSFLTMKQRRQP